MCGICGIVAFDTSRTVEPRFVQAMTDSIRHRGPDDDGLYAGGQAVLGHRRLAIIDLHRGHQPITNEDGTVWIVFNGEIYNYRELRQDLIARGHRLKTLSDTEVIVHLYEEHGAACVEHLRGMFAFAIWDARQRRLLLARDRVGIKPLYYTIADGLLLFASEIKALLTHPAVQRRAEPRAIDSFLMHNYVPGEDTALAGIRRLLPGHHLVLEGGGIAVTRWWDLHFPDQPMRGSEDELTQALSTLLEDAVREHMIADVPVGVLLSGGVDSTAMLSFAAEQTQRPVQTFTVGFSEPGITDERPYARIAARRSGSTHHEMTVSAHDFQAFLPRYVRHMEEPVCEPPAVALYYVTRLASQHVKVLLSGEGGDEAFAGYPNYRNSVWLERVKALGGGPSGAAAAGFELMASASGHPRWRRFAHALRNELADCYWSRTSGPLSPLVQAKADLYTDGFRSQTLQAPSKALLREMFEGVASESVLNRMLYVDTKTWLPDDLLIKADKMTMASSVELRVPLLDHRVLEFAAALPPHMKLKGLRTKHILKRALAQRVPREILERRKTGFPVPFQRWFNGELKDFVRGLLTDQCTRQRGYFEPRAVLALLDRCESGENLSGELFSLVTLELWHREFIDGAATPPHAGAAEPNATRPDTLVQ
jgi:asparagine synthase (glutamine-hydrolysing)